MVEDVTLLVKDLGIPRAVMVGHSMGGRVMMYLALQHPDLVEKLVSVDMSPVTNSPSLISMVSIFEAMRNVTVEENVSLSKARKMTDQQLSASINSPAIRQVEFFTVLIVGVDSTIVFLAVFIDQFGRGRTREVQVEG